MTPAEFERVEALFGAAMRLEPSARPGYLDEHCRDDPPIVRREVEAMLDAARAARTQFEPLDRMGVPGAADLLDAADDAGDPETIGPFRILRIIGRGGMGTVYEAQQETPQRRVALKVVRSTGLSPQLLRRFRREVEILGRLQHPGIAQVYEAGTFDQGDGPQPYFAMELVDGSPLTEHLRRRVPNVAEKLLLFARICDAVHYAHQKGVIHRDLKPENVLITVSGDPKVLDFGIARVTDGNRRVTTIQTRADQIIGTVQYMSPEQAGGAAADLDTRSDIYSLGVVLFEMLAGRLPYEMREQAIHESLATIQSDEPLRLSDLDSRFRGDVATIVGKCLEKDASRRYDSCSELASDVRRHLRHEPIQARPPSRWYQVRKFARRNRALVTGALATMIALALGIVAAVLFAVQAQRNEARALHQAYRASITAAAGLIDIEPAEARRQLDAAPQRFRGWEWSFLSAQLERRSGVLRAEAPLVGAAVMTPDGSSIVAVQDDGVVVAWPLDTNGAEPEPLHAFGQAVTLAAIDDACEHIGVVLEDGSLRIWSRSTSHEHALPAVPEAPISVMTWDHAGERLAIAQHGTILVGGSASEWQAIAIEDVPSFKVIRDIEFVPNAAELLVAVNSYVASAPGQAVRRIAIADGRTLAEYTTAEVPACLTMTPDGEHVAIGCNVRSVRTLHAAGLTVADDLGGHASKVTAIEFAPGGTLVASSGTDDTIRLWDVATATERRVLPETNGAIRFAPDGREVLVTAGRQVRRWDVERELSTVLHGHDSYVYEIDFSPDGSMLASSTYETTEVMLWDPRDGSTVRRVDIHAGSTVRLAFSADGRRLICGGHGTNALYQVIDVQTGDVSRRERTVLSCAAHDVRCWRGFTRWNVNCGGWTNRTERDPLLRSGTVWRAEYGDAFRLVVDGTPIAITHQTDLPFDVGPAPHLVCVGAAHHDFEFFHGHLAEFMIFDGILPDDTASAVEAYLRTPAPRHDPPMTPGNPLVMHLRADASSVTVDADGRVQSWAAANDASIVLREPRNNGAAASFDANSPLGEPAVTFGTGAQSGMLLGRLPAHVDLDSVTVIWRGRLDGNCSGQNPLFTIGQMEESSPEAWAALDEDIGGPRRISNSEAVSADGRLRAVLHGHVTSPLCLLDARSGAEIWRQSGSYRAVDFHPDSRHVAAASMRGTIDIWDVRDRRLVRVLEGHAGAVYGVAFSPDGTRLASGGNDTTIRIWDWPGGAPLLQLRGHDQYVKAVRFSPDGTQLASASGDRTVRIWDTVPAAERLRGR